MAKIHRRVVSAAFLFTVSLIANCFSLSIPQMSKVTSKLKVCVVGGGNAAHALAALLPYKGYETSMWCPHADEAERITTGLKEQGGFMVANFASHNTPSGEVKGAPRTVSKNAGDVLPSADIIMMPLPSFTYPSTLEAMKPFLRQGQTLCVTPGQGGFEWFAKRALGDDLMSKITIMGLMPMPFNCRISQFGKVVNVQELKRKYSIGVMPHEALQSCLDLVEDMFGEAEPAGNGTMLECTLWPINAVIHPGRLYTLLGVDWKTGMKLSENPLFYEDFTKEAASKMNDINADLIAVGKALHAAGVPISGIVPHIFDWLAVHVYDEPKDSNLQQFFQTSDAYKGFRCPLVQADGGWVPDFTNRYFTEDINLGLCGYKGLAEIVNVATPTFDEIIYWAQKHMGKEFLNAEGKLTGEDVGETNAPQRFGINSVKDLVRMYSSDSS